MRIVVCLQVAETLAAFISAGFWLISARANAPLMTWSGIGDLRKFLNRVSRYNFVAALFAAITAILAGLVTMLEVA
jgi:uncharacterized membrane protein